MVLSNAERQRRYVARLKAQAKNGGGDEALKMELAHAQKRIANLEAKLAAKPTKAATGDRPGELSKEEKDELRTQVRKEFLRKQREANREKAAADAADDKRPRMRQSPSGKPVMMFGRQIWPRLPEDYKELGEYDYDQMFFTVHQFISWYELLALNPKHSPAAQAIFMRTRNKSFMKFVDRRLDGRSQKEMKACFALFQKLADFLDANPTGERWTPPDLDRVFAGF